MRLTKTMREAFVRSVMQDVPEVDYETKLRDLMNKEIEKALKAAGLEGVDRDRLAYNYEYVEGFMFQADGLTDAELKKIKALPALVAMVKSKEDQDKSRNELSSKLAGAISACTTRKQAAEALPEFEKYLPADEPKALRSLPALANVAADFVKAGWPKGQKPTSKKPA